jgi:hypothetical protein
MKGRRPAFLFIGLLLLAAFFQFQYDSTIDYFGDHSAFVSLPSGQSLRVLSFGYRNLAADLLFIWSIQFYSTYNVINRFDYLERVYDTITDISPTYKDPYIVGSLIMAFEAKDVPMALRLLDKGSRNMPKEWFFDHEAGYYSFKYLKDYARAKAYYARAAAKPNAPSIMKRMEAHMVYLQDDPRAAYQIWLDIYNHAVDRVEKDAAFNHLYQIKADIDLPFIRQKIAAFRDKFKRFPADLSQLASQAAGAAVPKDFSGKDYLYDPLPGTVKAGRVFKWKQR